MNICMVYQGEYPFYERIYKEAKALSEEGHDVFLLSNNYGRFEKSEEFADNLLVIRIKPNIKNTKLARILKFPVFFNPLWIYYLYKTIKLHNIDILHVIDIPLSVCAITLGRIFNIPVVLDLWENYPEALKQWSKSNWKNYIFKNYKIAKLVESYAVKSADHVITVVEEQSHRLAEMGVPKDKISIVSNTVDLEDFVNSATKSSELKNKYKDLFILCYVGGIAPERGIHEVVNALKRVVTKIPKIKFIVLGRSDFPNYTSYLNKLVRDNNLSEYVEFVGWVDYKEIANYIEISSVCIVPHVYSNYINFTIPNKLFQYMALGKPIIVSNAKPLERIVKEGECGFVYKSGETEDLAKQIVCAAKSKNLKEIGKNGKDLIKKKYNWKNSSKELIKVYKLFE